MTQTLWDLDRASQYRTHEWDDGITLFQEGENSISLISPFAAYLLGKFESGAQSFQELLDRVRDDFPHESMDELNHTLEHTLEGLSQRGILIRTRL